MCIKTIHSLQIVMQVEIFKMMKIKVNAEFSKYVQMKALLRDHSL